MSTLILEGASSVADIMGPIFEPPWGEMSMKPKEQRAFFRVIRGPTHTLNPWGHVELVSKDVGIG